MGSNTLIIGSSWVGDMVMAQSLFKTLKQHNPDGAIDVLAPEWSSPILARMPEVRQCLIQSVGHGTFGFVARYKLGKSLRNKYQQVILLPNSFKSALLPFFAKIPIRTGWKGEFRYGLLNDLRRLNKKQYPLMVERFVALAFPKENKATQPLLKENYPSLTTDNKNIDALQKKYQFNTQRKILSLCPGAEFGTAKQWPEHHYATVAKQKIKEGWQVLILGSPADITTTDKIFSLLEKNQQSFCTLLAGKTALADAVDLLSISSAVISNDSGLMHIAAAVNAPLLAIYGSTSPDFTPPLSEKIKIIQSHLSCSPCFERSCPLQHKNCLEQQSPALILNALDTLINHTLINDELKN